MAYLGLSEETNRKVTTLSLAPDALVFINGQDVIEKCPDCNCGKKIKNNITAITVDLSTESAPGSATINIVNPQHVIEAYITDTGESAFRLMQEVEIYIKGRFPKNETAVYYPTFWGLITAISQNYSDGAHNITLSCKDILRWWEISNVNISPATIASRYHPSLSPNIYGNIYTNMTIPEIILSLSEITTQELAPPDTFFADIKSNEKIINKSDEDMIAYWKRRFGQIGRSMRVFGFNGKVLNQNFETVNKKVKDNYQNILNGVKTKLSNPDETFNKDEQQASTTDKSSKVVLGLNILDIEKIQPHQMLIGGLNLFQNTYQSKLEIANQIKELIKYEFFMDVNGEIIFKPPFYNLNVKGNTVNTIKDIDIIDFGLTQDESGIVTRADVTGSLARQTDSNKELIYGVYVDYYLAKQFGLRIARHDVPFFHNSKLCSMYAEAEVIRQNSTLLSGSMTIVGRPELHLGYPVFVEPLDSFFYVTGISHNFTFGSSFTTTLTITARRRKLYKDGKPRKWLAIEFLDVEEDNLRYAKDFGNMLVKSGYSEGMVVNELNLKFSTLNTDEVNSIISELFALTPQAKITVATVCPQFNPFDRIYNPCIDGSNEFTFDRRKTRMNIDLGNQGLDFMVREGMQITEVTETLKQQLDRESKDFKETYVGTNLKVDLQNFRIQRENDLLEEASENKQQITDGEGYEIIGSYAYGRNNKLLYNDQFGRLENQDIITQNVNNIILEMKPITLEGITQEISSETIRWDLSNKDQSMLIKDGTGSKAIIARDITIEQQDNQCNCTCHKRNI